MHVQRMGIYRMPVSACNWEPTLVSMSAGLFATVSTLRTVDVLELIAYSQEHANA